MTTDALDPGPSGDYPHMPRNLDGTLDTSRRPIAPHVNRSPDGRLTFIDPTPTLPDGRRVDEAFPLPTD